MRFFFSSPLTGPWKKEPRTEYILVWSPGARVGQAWLKVEAMNGRDVFESPGSGIATGILGFAVAEVGSGGRARKSGRMPGINSATTFCIDRAFCGVSDACENEQEKKRTWILTQLGGGASAMM